MRYAIIENEIIVNVFIADEEFIHKNNIDAIECPEQFCVGDNYINGEFILNRISVPEVEDNAEAL